MCRVLFTFHFTAWFTSLWARGGDIFNVFVRYFALFVLIPYEEAALSNLLNRN